MLSEPLAFLNLPSCESLVYIFFKLFLNLNVFKRYYIIIVAIFLLLYYVLLHVFYSSLQHVWIGNLQIFSVQPVILSCDAVFSFSIVTHSLQYFYTASSGIPGFPEFVNLGMVDGVQLDYYDSNIKKVVPKQDWMAKTEGPEYWERQTQVSIGEEQTFKANIDVAKQRFNQTGGEPLKI